MSLSMYDASLAQFIRMLGNLSAILDKAEAYAAERKIEASVLLNARLAPDMLPLISQVQIASDSVKGCAARLAGIDIPSYVDNESSFAELQARIAKTQAFLGSVTAVQLEGSEGKSITLNFPGLELQFTGQEYLLHFVLPNFYFHLTTAYAILRHNGLDIGKMDFLGRP
ncbi:DUF1993 domain-containing protein [Pseudomonas paeninsulae]|uniref:DUF1993 domain-containing protein n=1 Tax=Pseudomonas paeninsulae TaxID=3110772 RepID=UPI002D78AA8D|nr:DUF1993 domain-containing protein [Pseudomonas sp. IT1137]